MKHHIRKAALLGLHCYALLIIMGIAIIIITNSPVDNLIRGHYADIARLLTVLIGSILGIGVLQSALYILHHRFPVMTVTKYLFLIITSFVFPWLQIYALANKKLSVGKVAAFIRNDRYYASACSEGTESTILIAHNSGDINVYFYPDAIYLFMRMEDPAGIAVPPPESAWVLETSQDGHQALVCRLSIHSGITEMEAAQKIQNSVDQIFC